MKIALQQSMWEEWQKPKESEESQESQESEANICESRAAPSPGSVTDVTIDASIPHRRAKSIRPAAAGSESGIESGSRLCPSYCAPR